MTEELPGSIDTTCFGTLVLLTICRRSFVLILLLHLPTGWALHTAALAVHSAAAGAAQ